MDWIRFRKTASPTKTNAEKIVRGFSREHDTSDGLEETQSVDVNPLDYVSAPNSVIVLAMLFKESLDQQILEESLSRSLRRHPYLNGHIQCHGPRGWRMKLVFSNNGAAVTYKQTTKKLRDLLPLQIQEHDEPPFVLKPSFLLPNLQEFYPKIPPTSELCATGGKLLHVCITYLADGGTAVVVGTPHFVCDLHPLKSFMNTWSSEYTNLLNESFESSPAMGEREGGTCQMEKTVFSAMFDKTEARIREDSESLEEDVPGAINPGESLLGKRILDVRKPKKISFHACHIPASRVQIHRHKAMQDAQSDTTCPVSWISDNDVLSAGIWQALARIGSPRMVFIIASERKRLSPEIPNDFWGNCNGLIQVGLSTRDVTDRSISDLAAYIRCLVAEHTSENYETSYARAARILSQTEQVPSAEFYKNPSSLSEVYLLSTWKFSNDYEELSFGGNKPVWLQPGDLEQNNTVMITPVPPAVSGGGYLITFQLYRNLQDLFPIL